MNPNNRWVKKADLIPWNEIEGYIASFLADEKELSTKTRTRLEVIQKLYEQQLYMHKNKTHTVSDRIVSISQPYIRPIVQCKSTECKTFFCDFTMDYGCIQRCNFSHFYAVNAPNPLAG